MCTYEQKELGLSTYYDKRLVLPDGIHTEPIEYHLWSGGSSVWHERRAAPRARSHVWVHLFLICASFGCLWKSLGILRWNSLLAWHFMFCSRLNSPPTLATPSAKSTAGTCVLILIFAQHELIGEISKTQGNSQGWAPVLFINLVRILQLLILLRYFFISFHFCCELTHVNVWETFFRLCKSLFLCCSRHYFSLWCWQPLYKIHWYIIYTK